VDAATAVWAAQGNPKANPPYKILRWTFKGFNDRGGLEYADPMTLEVAAADEKGGYVADIYADAQGDVFILVATGTLERGERAQGSGHRVVKYGADGKRAWEYQNVQCAFAWNSGIYEPGYLVSAMLFPEQRSAGLLAVTGYYGQYFLSTRRTACTWTPSARTSAARTRSGRTWS